MSNQKLDTIIEELKVVNKTLFAIAFGFEDDEDFEDSINAKIYKFSEELKNAEETEVPESVEESDASSEATAST